MMGPDEPRPDDSHPDPFHGDPPQHSYQTSAIGYQLSAISYQTSVQKLQSSAVRHRAYSAVASSTPSIIHHSRRLGSFVSETMRSMPLHCTKHAPQASDRARDPQWSRAAFNDGKPKVRVSGVRSGFRNE